MTSLFVLVILPNTTVVNIYLYKEPPEYARKLMDLDNRSMLKAELEIYRKELHCRYTSISQCPQPKRGNGKLESRIRWSSVRVGGGVYILLAKVKHLYNTPNLRDDIGIGGGECVGSELLGVLGLIYIACQKIRSIYTMFPGNRSRECVG